VGAPLMMMLFEGRVPGFIGGHVHVIGGTTGPIGGQYTSIAFDQTSGANRPLALVYVVGSDGA
jgi:hypothetical protein